MKRKCTINAWTFTLLTSLHLHTLNGPKFHSCYSTVTWIVELAIYTNCTTTIPKRLTWTESKSTRFFAYHQHNPASVSFNKSNHGQTISSYPTQIWSNCSQMKCLIGCFVVFKFVYTYICINSSSVWLFMCMPLRTLDTLEWEKNRWVWWFVNSKKNNIYISLREKNITFRTELTWNEQKTALALIIVDSWCARQTLNTSFILHWFALEVQPLFIWIWLIHQLLICE